MAAVVGRWPVAQRDEERLILRLPIIKIDAAAVGELSKDWLHVISSDGICRGQGEHNRVQAELRMRIHHGQSKQLRKLSHRNGAVNREEHCRGVRGGRKKRQQDGSNNKKNVAN